MSKQDKTGNEFKNNMMTRRTALTLALQLPFCFEVRSLSGSLVSSAPE